MKKYSINFSLFFAIVTLIGSVWLIQYMSSYMPVRIHASSPTPGLSPTPGGPTPTTVGPTPTPTTAPWIQTKNGDVYSQGAIRMQAPPPGWTP